MNICYYDIVRTVASFWLAVLHRWHIRFEVPGRRGQVNHEYRTRRGTPSLDEKFWGFHQLHSASLTTTQLNLWWNCTFNHRGHSIISIRTFEIAWLMLGNSINNDVALWSIPTINNIILLLVISICIHTFLVCTCKHETVLLLVHEEDASNIHIICRDTYHDGCSAEISGCNQFTRILLLF